MSNRGVLLFSHSHALLQNMTKKYIMVQEGVILLSFKIITYVKQNIMHVKNKHI
jgi:hypothetical protein